MRSNREKIMLDCHLHDYIEIACMLHIEVTLTYKDGTTITGIANDTVYNTTHDECIEVIIDGQKQSIVLTQLASMLAITPNPHFELITF